MSIIPGWGFTPSPSPQGGLELAGSINFNGSNEGLEISSFSSSSPNQRTFTVAFWVRFDDVDASTFPVVLSIGGPGAYFEIYLQGLADRITADDAGDSEVGTTSFSNDTWYHVCVSVDTDAGSPNDRIILYLDGSSEADQQYSETSRDTYMFENGETLAIGFSAAFGGDNIDGRIADLIVIEGQALTPSEVNYDPADGGKWKDYTGEFGDHGFRINPQNSSQIGTDQSGNGYDFTLNNMDASNFDSGVIPPT